VFQGESFVQLVEAALGLWEQGWGGPGEAEALARSAVGHLERFARVHPSAGPRILLADGQVALLEGRPRRARRSFARAVASAQRFGMPYEEARAHLGLGRALGSTSDQGETAQAHLARSAELLEQLGAAHAVTVGGAAP
jgi:hypothetical protein